MTAKLTKSIEVELTPQDIAAAFCQMDDDEQSQFFVHVAAIMTGWCEENPAAFYFQTNAIGSHLRTCKCSTEEARDLVRLIAESAGSEVP